MRSIIRERIFLDLVCDFACFFFSLGPMVGQYTVMLEEFEPVALRALSSKSNTLIIDEIGKMENFRNNISTLSWHLYVFLISSSFDDPIFLCTVNELYYFDRGENVSFCSVKFKAEVRRIFEERRTGHILATIPQSRGRPLPLGTEAWYIEWGSRNRSILDWAHNYMWAQNL